MLSNHQQPSQALDRVLASIVLEPDLEPAEERDLARAARRGDERAAHRLVAANLRRVLALARSFRNKGLPLEDLVHEGSVGLLEALKQYDPDRGVRFFTYAAFHVRRGLVRAISRGAKTVRVPRHVASRIQAARSAPADAVSAAPAPIGTFEISTDERVDPRRATTRGDLLPDTHALLPEESLLARERIVELARALDTLPARERQVLASRYGLSGDEPATLRHVGANLKLSKERVRQLEDRAKASLRRDLGERLSAATQDRT